MPLPLLTRRKLLQTSLAAGALHASRIAQAQLPGTGSGWLLLGNGTKESENRRDRIDGARRRHPAAQLSHPPPKAPGPLRMQRTGRPRRLDLCFYPGPRARPPDAHGIPALRRR